MKNAARTCILALAALAAAPAAAQRRPPAPGGRSVDEAGPSPAANGAATPERQVAPRGLDEGSDATEAAPARRANCDEVRRKAKYGIYFDKVDIEKLVQTVSDATCKTFILGENIRGKISIIRRRTRASPLPAATPSICKLRQLAPVSRSPTMVGICGRAIRSS